MVDYYDSVPAATFTLKYKDYFHLKHFYMMTYLWLKEEGWCTEDHKWPEQFYIQRDIPKFDKTIKYGWRMEKYPQTYKDKFIKWTLNIDIQVIQLRDAEIVYQNQKYSTNWGEIRIDVKSEVKVDPDKMFSDHWLLKNFANIFKTRIYRDIILKHRQELYRDTYRLQEAMKGYFDLRTYLPEPEDQAGLLFPKKGVGEA